MSFAILERKRRNVRLLWSTACILLLSGSVTAQSRIVRCDGREQPYVYFSPDQTKSPRPTVMLLHGAGDRPENMIDAWRRLASKEKINLLAPALPRELNYEESAPRIFRCVVEDAKQLFVIDPQRVFLFGNSMGGYLAYDAAVFQSQYFAAVAVHGMRIAEDYAWIVDRAQRKTPIAIYIGDHDQFSSVASVLKTRDLLKRAGFPLHYVEMVNHDHNYYDRSDEINADAWKFMKDHPLPLAPT